MRLVPYSDRVGILLEPPAAALLPTPAPTASWDSPTMRMTCAKEESVWRGEVSRGFRPG